MVTTLANPNLEGVRAHRVTWAEKRPQLAIAYSRSPRAGEVPTAQAVKATAQVVGDEGGYVRLILKEYIRDADGQADGTTTTNIDGNVETTLKAIIDKINSLRGFTAWALHAPHAFNVEAVGTDYDDMAETDIPTDGKPLEVLENNKAARDLYLRLGTPTVRDEGRMALLGLTGSHTGHGTAYLRISRDAYGEGEEVLESAPPAEDADVHSYFDRNKLEAPVYRGPLLFTFGSDNVTAAEYVIREMEVDK